MIIVGDTRLEAAKRLNLEKVPVLVRAMSKEDAKAYRIADNRVGEETDWLNSGLADERRMLDELGVELALTGFDEDELDDLLNPLDDDDGPEPDTDSVNVPAISIGIDTVTYLNSAIRTPTSATTTAPIAIMLDRSDLALAVAARRLESTAASLWSP